MQGGVFSEMQLQTVYSAWKGNFFWNSGHLLSHANFGFQNNNIEKWPPETQLSLIRKSKGKTKKGEKRKTKIMLHVDSHMSS